jgi:Tfp pilus assembly major pilin PilA
MHPSFPKSLRIVIVLATTAALLAFPIPALGAKGVDLTADIDALIETVSPGGQTAYRASFDNTGTSTIAHLRFDGTLPGGTFVSATGPCGGGGSAVGCDFGNLASGESVTLIAFFTASSNGGVLTFNGAFSGDARQNNQGAAKDDTWQGSVKVTVDASGDFFGSWQRSHGKEVTFQTQTISGNNHQSTRVDVPAFVGDYPASIREVEDATTCGIDGVGQAVDLDIAGGEPIDLTVTLRLDAVAAEGRTPGSVSVLHDCEPVPSNCQKNAAPCYDASWERNGRDKILVIKIQLPSNGRLKLI